MDSLPPEPLTQIASYLHPADACSLLLVSKTLHLPATEQAFSVLTLDIGDNIKASRILARKILKRLGHG